jgi:large repetitive protein
VTLAWAPPTSGPAPSAYTVVASLSPEGPLVATLPVGLQTSVVVPAPDGTYYVRVVATVAGTTIPSNQIAVVVGPTPVPSAPLALGATVTGSTFILAWSPPANVSVAPVQTYVIEAGTAIGLTNLANFATGSAARSFVTPPVADGSYYLRLRARNATGTGPPTSDLRVVVGPPPPGPPVLTGSVGAGASVSLAWTSPTTGAAITGYQLQAGTAPGLVNAAALLLPATPLAFATAGVPAGTYYVRVVATSAIGLGLVSNELVLVVP